MKKPNISRPKRRRSKRPVLRGSEFFYDADLLYVFDGDSVKVHIDKGMGDIEENKMIRFARISAKEVDEDGGEAATVALINFIHEYGYVMHEGRYRILIGTKKGGKYGRYVAEVYLPVKIEALPEWAVPLCHKRGDYNLINLNDVMLDTKNAVLWD
jgi:endonuclease YncB( thermonuclease family)